MCDFDLILIIIIIIKWKAAEGDDLQEENDSLRAAIRDLQQKLDALHQAPPIARVSGHDDSPLRQHVAQLQQALDAMRNKVRTETAAARDAQVSWM